MAFAKDMNTTMKVSGWHCEGCAASTENAVKKVKGVKTVKTDLARGTVEVSYDDAQCSPQDLEKAIEKAGYKVQK
jgi:copper chaperone CopZ